MTEAFFGLVGVLVGALASAGTTLWVTRWTARQQLAQRDREIMRDALFALQESLSKTLVGAGIMMMPQGDRKEIDNLVDLLKAIDRMGISVNRIGDAPLRRAYFAYRATLLHHAASASTVDNWSELLSHPDVQGNRDHLHRRATLLIHYPEQCQKIPAQRLLDRNFDLDDGPYLFTTNEK